VGLRRTTGIQFLKDRIFYTIVFVIIIIIIINGRGSISSRNIRILLFISEKVLETTMKSTQ
jgi:hypothetical protein